jgi:ribosomal protein L31E
MNIKSWHNHSVWELSETQNENKAFATIDFVDRHWQTHQTVLSNLINLDLNSEGRQRPSEK